MTWTFHSSKHTVSIIIKETQPKEYGVCLYVCLSEIYMEHVPYQDVISLMEGIGISEREIRSFTTEVHNRYRKRV